MSGTEKGLVFAAGMAGIGYLLFFRKKHRAGAGAQAQGAAAASDMSQTRDQTRSDNFYAVRDGVSVLGPEAAAARDTSMFGALAGAAAGAAAGGGMSAGVGEMFASQASIDDAMSPYQ